MIESLSGLADLQRKVRRADVENCEEASLRAAHRCSGLEADSVREMTECLWLDVRTNERVDEGCCFWGAPWCDRASFLAEGSKLSCLTRPITDAMSWAPFGTKWRLETLTVSAGY